MVQTKLLRGIKFPKKKSVEADVYLPQDWSEGALKIAIYEIL